MAKTKATKVAKKVAAAKVTKPASASQETPIKLTQEQINSWMPPIARGLIPLDDAAEKLVISRRQLSAYLGNWKRRQKRQAIQNIVDRLPGVDVAEEEKVARKERARKAKNARQRERRAKARELAKVQETAVPEPVISPFEGLYFNETP